MSGAQQILASPLCSVDILPFEGGQFAIQGGQVLECIIEKDLRSDQPGVCRIILAPGGPNGVAAFPSWSQVITLQSLVIVAMQRGNYSNVVFVGIVQMVGEGQAWEPATRVIRTTTIQAADFMSYFSSFNWNALAFLGATNGVAQGEVAGLTGPGQGIVSSVLSEGQLNGNPGQIANGWLTRIMGGTKGVLSQTKIPYPSNTGQNLLWPAAITSYFAAYPYGTTFPSSYFFISQAGNWFYKFLEICQPPWYELIIGTAPEGTWDNPPRSPPARTPQPADSAAPTQTDTATVLPTVDVTANPDQWYKSGQHFYSSTLTQAIPAQVQIVGRLMPMPDLTLVGTVSSPESLEQTSTQGLAGQQAYKFASKANLALWNALPLFSLDEGQGFIRSAASLSLQTYYNFFTLTPLYFRNLIGQSEQAQGTFPFAYSAAANIASIHRFGFMSMQMDTYWVSDAAQWAAQSSLASGNAMANLVAVLITRMATYYTPLVYQKQGNVQLPLRPDIFPGCRFQYSPFRGDEDWQFYVCGIRHKFTYGGPSVTELDLDRGLPTSVYQDLELMAKLLQGNVQQKDGDYLPGLPSGEVPLQTFGTAPAELQVILGEIAKIYATAQAQ